MTDINKIIEDVISQSLAGKFSEGVLTMYNK